MADFPLNPVRRAGNILFISGQIGIRDGQLVEGGINVQLEQAVANIVRLLGKENLSLENIVDVSAFLVDPSDYEIFNESYRRLFQAPYPTRTTVFVRSLPANALVELKVVAEAGS